jgi:hypothetical protein
MRKDAFCERLEEKVLGGKANKFENWIYDYFFTLDSSLPPHLRYKNREKALAYATNELLAKYFERAEAIANRLNVTPERVTILYFAKLNDYVEGIYGRYRAGYGKSQIEEYIKSLEPIKTELMELFEGTTIETLEIAGRPYYKMRHWDNPYTGGWNNGAICPFLSGVQSRFGIKSCHDPKSTNGKKVRFRFFS